MNTNLRKSDYCTITRRGYSVECHFLFFFSYFWNQHFTQNKITLIIWHLTSTSFLKLFQTPCMSSPCQNEGTCVANYKYHSIDCRCKKGFYGEFCEKGNWYSDRAPVQVRTTKLSGFTSNLSGNILTALWRVRQHWCYHGKRIFTAMFFRICFFSKK